MTDHTVKDDWLDAEFSSGGWIESDEDRTFGSAFPDELLIHRGNWRDKIEDRQAVGYMNAGYSSEPFNQERESSCVYNAAAGCLQLVRNFNLGRSHEVILSPMSGYCRVARSRHSGSTMSGALEETSQYGLLPSSGHGQPGTFRHTFHENAPFARERQLPNGWKDTARHFRTLEWLRIDDREQFGSALLQASPMPICYGRSGHSIRGDDMVWTRGQFLCRSCNSYGLSGDDGWLYDTERLWAIGGAWACRVVTLPDDPTRPTE